MATATMPRAGYSTDIKLEYGVAQVFALKYTTGKNCGEAKFPPFGPRVMYTAIDDRKLWLGADDASDVDHALLDLGIEPGEFIRVLKVKHPRGGGHSIRVERADDAQDAPAWVREDAAPAPRPPSREEALLEQSVTLARQHGARAFHAGASRVSPEITAAPAMPSDTGNRTASFQLMSAFTAAIDALCEAQAYADRKGLKVTFTNDDVRAVAISAFIQAEKAAMGARY